MQFIHEDNCNFKGFVSLVTVIQFASPTFPSEGSTVWYCCYFFGPENGLSSVGSLLPPYSHVKEREDASCKNCVSMSDLWSQVLTCSLECSVHTIKQEVLLSLLNICCCLSSESLVHVYPLQKFS